MDTLLSNSKKIYFAVSVLFVVLTFSIGIYNTIYGDLSSIVESFISPAFLFIPILYSKLFKARRYYLFDAKLILFIFLAYDLGICLKLYHTTQYYDLFSHTLAGIVFAEAGICIYLIINDKKINTAAERVSAVLFGFFFCSFVSSVWEFAEYAASKVFGGDPQWVRQTGVGDTMDDMLVSVVGAIIIAVIFAVCAKRDKHDAVKYISNGIIE